MTIADKLSLLNATKTAIADAIETKGVTVGSIPFSQYSSKILLIQSGAPSTLWERPVDWLNLPTLTDLSERLVGLVAVHHKGTDLAFIAAGNYTVDWGDGVVEDYNAYALAEHRYDYSTYDVSETTLCSRGYKQAVVQVYPQSGEQLSLLNLHKIPTRLSNNYQSPWLDIAIAGQYLYTLILSTTAQNGITSVMGHSSLEQAKIYKNSVTVMGSLFKGCISLKSVPVLWAEKVTNMPFIFNGCYSLVEVCNINAPNLNNIQYMFSNAYALKKAPEITTSKVTSFNNLFSGCASLKEVPAYNMLASTSIQNMFSNCFSLSGHYEINAPLATNASSAFNGCKNIRSVTLTLGNLVDATSLFSGCNSLTNIEFPSGFNPNKITSFLDGCNVLKKLSGPTFGEVVSGALLNAFRYCYSLAEMDTSFPLYSFSLADANFEEAELNALFDLLPEVTSQTINITNNPGAAACDRTIAISKGWSVVG